MADIELVIKIPEEYYKAITEIPNHQCTSDMLIIKNGTPIPDNATNGEVMRAIFPDGVKTSIAYPRDVSKEWINAPYQKGGKVE